MKSTGEKTARFANVVKAAGQPEAITLWTRPEDDADFMKAVRDGRIMSVRQANAGTRKDHGEVGFVREPGYAWLKFPKSLKEFEGARIVGINYELLATPERESTRAAKSPRSEKKARVAPAPRPKPVPPPKPEPVEKRFRVTIERTANVVTEREVVARNAAEAEEKARAMAESGPFEAGAIRTRVLKARLLR